MKLFSSLVVTMVLLVTPALSDNPIQKVVQLLTELEGKIMKDGEVEQKAYEEYVDWCQNGAQDKHWEIKTAKAEIEDLEATISKEAAIIDSSTSKISELAASISTDEADLKAATEIRDKEHADFAASEGELVDALDTLDRAISIIEKNMKGSALIQAKVNLKDVAGVVEALKSVIEAASLNVHDKKTLLGLAQSNDADSDDDSEMGAPDPEAYKSHGGSILDVLDDMKEKAEGQLTELRKAEMNAKHNYEMLEQSLTDSVSADTKEMQGAKTAKSNAEENKAVAEGDLAVTKKDLADAEDVLGGMSQSCMQTATDHEASVKGRAEELAVLAKAKQTIQQTTSGAGAQTYSFFQKGSNVAHEKNVAASGSRLKTGLDLANFEVVNWVRKMARDQHSQQLSLLAGRIAAAYRASAATGEDPFAKVKSMITDMIARLTKEGEEEASHKAWCDKETAETNKKKEELNYDIDKLSTKIDKAKAQSEKLKGETAELAKEIAEITKSQAEMDKIRKEENAAFLQTKADLEKGIDGVRMALKVLRDYYSAGDAALIQGAMGQPAAPETHDKSSGAGSSIIGFLEVIESDFAKNLAEETTEEDSAAVEYEKVSQENRISKSMKEQDVKYKTKEAASLDKEVSETASDLESAQAELDSVLEASKNIRAMCELKPETYEERKARREAEIAGLKEALQILEGEAVFLQEKKRGIKGAFMHAKRHSM
jgi:hypothetical protein